MLNRAMPEADVGVIVGRFQVPYLHEGHGALIESVLARHKKVLILVGKTPGVLVTRDNPLDYHTRRLMINAAYPDAVVMPLNDMPSDEDWSRAVDRQIDAAFDGAESVLLYGSRDSFIPYYSGKWPTVELEQSHHWSGTAIRKMVSDDVRNEDAFRQGVIYAAFNQHPTAYPTVDAAIIDFDQMRIFLGQKETDCGLLRFPGGFVDPRQDASLEDAVRREVNEEMGLGIDPDVTWIGSSKVDDWRYRGTENAVITNLFVVRYMFGGPKAADDLQRTEVCSIEFGFDVNRMVPEHRPLMEKVLTYLEKESN